MPDKKRFAEKAASGYVVCFVEACPLREEIRHLFRDFGWTKPVEFDGYVEEYEW